MFNVRRMAMTAALGAACATAAIPATSGATTFARTPLINKNAFDSVAASVVWENRQVIVSGRETNLGHGPQVCFYAYDSFQTMVAATCRSVPSGTRGFDFTLTPRESHAIRYVKAESVISSSPSVPALFIAGASRPS
jgi:hypothetical protein